MTGQRPAYRYLEAPPATPYGRLGHCLRWALVLSALAWFLIFAAGFLLARSGGP